MTFADYPKKNWCIDGEKLDRRTKVFEFKTVNDLKESIEKYS